MFVDSSTERVKTNIAYMEDSEKILDVQPISYHDKKSFEELGEEANRQYGFSAEEMFANIEGNAFVVIDAEGLPEAIQYDRLVVPLFSAVRSLRARIKDLEEKIARMEDQ
jgi:hypothetical protein